jgi:ligand-binding SRPBCC domain-containing protein
VRRAYVLERTQVVPVAIDEAFGFFADPRNLEQITPPWLRFRIVEVPLELRAGAVLRYRLELFRIPVSWRTVIAGWTPPRGFVDVQRHGPYALWEHVHRLTPHGDQTEIYDHVSYRLFGGPFGRVVHALVVRRWLDEIFDFRADALVARFGKAS